MSDLRELYQQVILDHYKKPRNCRALAEPACRVEGYNPLCGDKFTVYLQLDGGRIKDVSFQGAGCAISTASASMMTDMLKGKTVAEAEQLFHAFHELVTASPADKFANPAGESGRTNGAPPLGKLAVFAGVREFPLRVKCATLAWHTLHAALQGQHEPVSTE